MPRNLHADLHACKHCVQRPHLPFISASRSQHRRPNLAQHLFIHHRSVSRGTFKHACHCAATKTQGTPAQTTSYTTENTRGAQIVIVVPANQRHHLGASWQDVVSHVAERLTWESPDFKAAVYTDEAICDQQQSAEFENLIQRTDIMLVMDIQNRCSLDMLVQSMQAVPTSIALNSLPELATTKLDNITLETPWQKASAAILPWSSSAKGIKVLQSIRDVYQRNTSDDLLFMLLVLIDAYITKVPLVQSMQAQDLSSVWKMCTKCGKQIWACIQDPECKAALDCLTACSSNDQVCSFRCIVSYESPLLQDFSLCILQKNNCLGLSADIPAKPEVEPMAHFRGKLLTHDQAEEIFIGWLPEKRWSWRVVAGQNVAYDQFPSQYQLFYHGKARNSLWYDPVFQVKTLEGKTVWRRRHYRVRRAQQPGTFFFSVLDNGVISKEYWRIVHAAEDLSWALFYYAGAASVVGQAYRGAVLVTPDGDWPAADQQPQLEDALQQCGIKIWELYKVDNSSTTAAPLTVPEGPMKTVESVI